MNRFTVACYLFVLTALPALSQEIDTVGTGTDRDSIHRIARDTLPQVQQDSLNYAAIDSIYRIRREEVQVTDTVAAEVKVPKSPTRALMYALVLPGLGQLYNEKYYKIPIVWAAMGASGYAIVYNTRKYREATLDYLEEPGDDRFIKGWRRYMELSYIAAILVYGLQILDAYVDANMYTWDVNENLSMGISPSLQPLMAPTSSTGYSGGFTCSFKFKGR